MKSIFAILIATLMVMPFMAFAAEDNSFTVGAGMTIETENMDNGSGNVTDNGGNDTSDCSATFIGIDGDSGYYLDFGALKPGGTATSALGITLTQDNGACGAKDVPVTLTIENGNWTDAVSGAEVGITTTNDLGTEPIVVGADPVTKVVNFTAVAGPNVVAGDYGETITVTAAY